MTPEQLKAALDNAHQRIGELYVYSVGLEEQNALLRAELDKAAHEHEEGETCSS